MTLGGKFFDFEAAGYNSFIQDVAIFVYYNYFGGHYLVPKYSATEPFDSLEELSPGKFRCLKQFADDFHVGFSISEDTEEVRIDFDFVFPKIKKEMLRQFVNEVVIKVEELLPRDACRQLVSELQSAILLRVIGVKNLRTLEEKDMVISLAFANIFSQPDDKSGKISDFISSIFNL